VWVLAAELVGCERGRSAVPIVPLPPSVPAAPTLIVFAEPDMGFSTSEVYDVQEQVLQFNTFNWRGRRTSAFGTKGRNR
jgi:hypothetical protein